MAGDIPQGTYNLQFGSSFTAPAKKEVKKYHALRYDFKPKSVSNNTDTFIAFRPEGTDVHVTVPTEGENMTVYKGSKKDAKPKECLLFFDKNTGTVRLEKISSNINVKQTRDLDKATETVLRTEMARLTAAPSKTQPKPSREHSSSSSNSGSDSDSQSSDDEASANAVRTRSSSTSSVDEMESQLLATMNAPTNVNSSSPLDDMPLLEARPPSRPVSSNNSNSIRPQPVQETSSHDRLGLNLSESSDSDDE